jgi:hypothetical protein
MSAPAQNGIDDMTHDAETLECPLCDYDLRGQVEPRCPECGYRFDWDELRDPARRLHPYLFEHHPERNVTSFLQTVLGGMRPRRFWKTLYPTQRSRPWRLWIYFAIVFLSGAIPIGGDIATTGMKFHKQRERNRAAMLAAIQAQVSRGRVLGTLTPQQFVDRNMPPLTRREIVHASWEISGQRFVMRHELPALLWPIITFLAMMVFQISMLRARVRAIHVARCVVYTSDVLLWYQVALAIGVVATQLGARFDFETNGYGLMSVALLFFMYRFAMALRLYLRFDHPVSTMLATQAIAALAVLAVMLNVPVRW